jgi:prolyl 4-hydroxylase
MQVPVLTVDDTLHADACVELIARIERLGPAPTVVRSDRGIHADASLRNNTRVWFDDAPLAAHIFEAIAPAVETLRARLPALLVGDAIECEGTFRGYRYRAGERFAPHVDGVYVRDDGARTLLTVLVYLNGDVDGGATRFPEAQLDVQPVAGRVCIFPHVLLHEGAVVERGTKYALRTNVVFA